MVLKIHGHPQSTCTRRVIAVAKEKNIEYEIHTVDWINREYKTAGYMEKQPFGQMPYIDDDGLIFFESRAICRYIATKFASQGTPLLPDPSDLTAVIKFEQATSIEAFNFEPFVAEIASEKIFKVIRGLKPDEERVALATETLKGKLEGYESILSKQAYLAGDEITLADIFHLPYGSMLPRAGVDLLENGTYPNVTRWWKELAARPAWQGV